MSEQLILQLIGPTPHSEKFEGQWSREIVKPRHTLPPGKNSHFSPWMRRDPLVERREGAYVTVGIVPLLTVATLDVGNTVRSTFVRHNTFNWLLSPQWLSYRLPRKSPVFRVNVFLINSFHFVFQA